MLQFAVRRLFKITVNCKTIPELLADTWVPTPSNAVEPQREAAPITRESF
jgi:hypothetical protein